MQKCKKKILNFRLQRSQEEVVIKVRDLTVDKLSGGERSKTLVCLIGALWNVQSAPFLCLDEWDVGLDDDARPDVERLLMTIGTKVQPQLFLVNPTKSSAHQTFGEEIEAKIKRLRVSKNL